ncbi:MAG: hypothetical protein IJ002_02400 [Clostridia bacterium]|nr:hypothetical protein [Clostridia bacterium]
MKNPKEKRKNNSGIALFAAVVVLVFVLGLAGMYALGIISMPAFLSDFIETDGTSAAAPIAGNIAAEDESIEYFEALPREEYATALADISVSDKYYQHYTVTVYSGEKKSAADYTAIMNGNDWWVQTSENDVIMSTVVCKDGKVKISDNTDNTSIVDESGEIHFSEYFGYTPLSELTAMIKALANGETVDYAGGITDFSLSFTQARGTGENIFSFSFTRADGFSEEYTFAFESATVLTAAKYSPSGEKIYQMEMKDSLNNIDDIDVDALFVID